MPDKPNYAGRPTICRNCGALVGAGEAACLMCGAAFQPAPQPAMPMHERYAMSFARAVLARPYIFTIIFLVANIFVFMLMWEASGMKSVVLWTAFPEEVLREFGAKTNYAIHFDHEYWRLVTPIFIHLNLPHLLINMYSLWVIGPWVEKLYGSAKFVVFWVATGIAGVLASYLSFWPDAHPGLLLSFLIKRSDGPSAGASGALFGLVGVLFVFGIKYRRELPDGFKRAFGTGMIPVIVLNLGIGFIGRGFIDNAAHMGGLLSGAALAGVFSYKRPGESAKVTMAWRVVQIASLILIAGCFLLAARAHQRNPEAGATTASAEMATRKAEFAAFDANHNDFQAGQVAFVDALTKNNAGEIARAIAKLEKIEYPSAQTDALRADLKALLIRAQKFVSDWSPPRQLTQEGSDEKKHLADDFKQWQERYKNWYWTAGEKFGVQRPTPTPAN